jgi:hypothetical protein
MPYKFWYDFCSVPWILRDIADCGQYLMAFYLFLSERHGSGVGSRWALMGLAVRLGISVST